MVEAGKAVANAVKTGKVLFGVRRALKSAKAGKAKLIIISNNCPPQTRQSVEYYCKLSRVPIFVYEGNNVDLGAMCRKPFMVSALTVRDPGDSDILMLVGKANVHKVDRA